MIKVEYLAKCRTNIYTWNSSAIASFKRVNMKIWGMPLNWVQAINESFLRNASDMQKFPPLNFTATWYYSHEMIVHFPNR